MRRVLVVVTALAVPAACTEGAGGPAEGHRAGRSFAAICTSPLFGPADGGVLDSSLPDGPGPGSDGGPPDGGLPDGGTGSDGGLPDGGSPDGGMGSDGGPPGDGGMDCKGLDIVEAMIPLVPMGTGTAEVRSVPGFTDQLVSASITGDGFAFTTPGCAPQACDFAAMPRALPFVLTIACNATDGVPHAGTLRAQGAQGPSDFDTASLSCAGSANVPLISVAPASINAGDVPVNASSNHMFTVTNNGTATLTFSISLPSMAPAWTAPGSACIAPAQCAVPAGGGTAAVAVRFTPTTHGPSAGTIAITSNAGPRTVDVAGTGRGSRIVVIDPSDHDLDFGTIPRNSTTNRPIAVSAIGNLPVSIDAADPGAPFSVTPAQLALTPGVPQAFTVSCGAATATGPVSRAVALASPDAYALDAAAIDVHCEVVDTQVSVEPTAFDFMEVRKGVAAPALPFTISNPGPLAATITAVELGGAPASLTMSVEGAALPRTLQVGQSITGRMALATEQDLDLAQTAPRLRIAVDGAQLLYPVTGKVTTPAAYVTPERLDLGTVCIGSDVSATVSMINSGTARLAMERPEADAAFTLGFQSPPEYPAPLLAGTMATIDVSPAAQVPSELSGRLTWAVDAPRSPFLIDVDLRLIDTGTAISPASLDFSTVEVDQTSIRYSVTMQNCSTAPAMVTVDGVTSSRGGTAAWRVDPSSDARTLAPQDKLTISVAFAPRRHGRHVAQLRLAIDGEPRLVELVGDGLDPDFKPTSFYACGCSTPRAGGGGPIVIAVAAVVLRRRRRRPRRAAPHRA